MKRLTPVMSSGATILAVLALAGCTTQGSSLADDYEKTAGSGYVSGDGQTQTYPEDSRKAAVSFSGETDSGDDLSSDSLVGEVVVLNFWYASCPPCRAEAPELSKLSADYADAGVSFLGVNVLDSAATAKTFSSKFDLTYPSILDAGENTVQLAFADNVPPKAVPTTLILDRKGRVAASFNGAITDPDLVASIIDDTLAEKS